MLDFLLFYEHFNREYANLFLLKRYLEQKGYTAKIAHFCNEGYSKYMRKKPKVIVTPWLRDNENVFLYTRKNSNAKIVNLQMEQIYSQNDYASGLCATIGKAKNAFHICWGNKKRDEMLQEGISANNLPVLGAIQLDFTKERFENYFIDRRELFGKFNIDYNKRVALYISSFAYATYNKNDLQYLQNLYGDLSPLINCSVNSRIEMLKWIEFVCKHQDIEFVYRPHPSENMDNTILELENKLPNFHIITDYTVLQWIKACDLIYTWLSTSIAEAVFSKKRFFVVRPFPIPDQFDISIYKNAFVIDNMDDFNLSVNGCPTTDSIIIDNVYAYYRQDGYAYERIGDFLVSVLNSKCEQDFALSDEEIKHYKKKYAKHEITSRVCDIIVATNIRFSKIFPFKRKQFANLEKRVRFLNQKKKEVEKRIDKILRGTF